MGGDGGRSSARERCPKVAVKGRFLGRVRLVGCVFAVAYAHTLTGKAAASLRRALNGSCTRVLFLILLLYICIYNMILCSLRPLIASARNRMQQPAPVNALLHSFKYTSTRCETAKSLQGMCAQYTSKRMHRHIV